MVIIKPPKEAQTNKLWKLNKCVYGLADSPRCWYLRLKEEFLKLSVTIGKYDPGLFYYTSDSKLQGLMVCYVGKILWDDTDEFKADAIDCLGQIFTIGSKFSKVFTYLGIQNWKHVFWCKKFHAPQSKFRRTLYTLKLCAPCDFLRYMCSPHRVLCCEPN